MNNAVVIKAKSHDEAIEMASEGVLIAEPDAVVVRAIRFLMDNVHFKTYVRRVIETDIALERSKLESEQDPIQMYRMQGYIKGLEKMKDLERFKKIYQAKIDRTNYGKTESK